MFELIIGIVTLLALTPVGVFVYVLVRSYQLEREVELVIEEYRSHLNGSNRFLFDEQLMRKVFPEFSDYVIHKVWARLVATKAIERDVMDGAWCIK